MVAQQHSSTAAQQHSSTAAQQHSSTAAQQHSTVRHPVDILVVVRNATALHRLLDVLPAFGGDRRIVPLFTLVPGSEFGADALAALDGTGARSIPWTEALTRPFGLILAASPNGGLHFLKGPLVLLPHGAGFNKVTVDDKSSTDGEEPGSRAVGGLNPGQLLHEGRAIAALHALAHPRQLTRLAAESPAAAAPAAVVGDPTLDRILASQPRRDRYREALGTGARKLVVLVSTWGEQSLLAGRPRLPLELADRLPCDAYQVALVLHPNEHCLPGPFALRSQLAPALDAGLVLLDPHEGWGAALVASDCVVTDHGSTALYAAALDKPLLSTHEGGRHDSELLPGSPMDLLLAQAPYLEDDPYEQGTGEHYATQIDAALDAHRPGSAQEFAAPAFSGEEKGRSLERLRGHCYSLLGLDPPPGVPQPRPLPVAVPGTAPRTPAAFTVTADVTDRGVRVERRPVNDGPPGGHVAAEEDLAGLRDVQSAAVLFRRRRTVTGSAAVGRDVPSALVTADQWTTTALDSRPGCRTAGAVLTHDHVVLRIRGGALLSARISAQPSSAGSEGTAPAAAPDRTVRPDPAAVLSGLHAWLAAQDRGVFRESPEQWPFRVRCLVADAVAEVTLTLADEAAATAEL